MCTEEGVDDRPDLTRALRASSTVTLSVALGGVSECLSSLTLLVALVAASC